MKKTKLLKIITLLLTITLISVSGSNLTTYAQDTVSSDNLISPIIPVGNTISTEIELLDNGDYIETVISTDESLADSILNVSTLATTKTITKTKTSYYKNAAGSVMWSVSIKGTFTYNGSTSKCTKCSHSTTAPGKSWSIKSCTSSKSGNKATAKAVATHKSSSGATANYTKSVTITCSAKGVVS